MPPVTIHTDKEVEIVSRNLRAAAGAMSVRGGDMIKNLDQERLMLRGELATANLKIEEEDKNYALLQFELNCAQRQLVEQGEIIDKYRFVLDPAKPPLIVVAGQIQNLIEYYSGDDPDRAEAASQCLKYIKVYTDIPIDTTLIEEISDIKTETNQKST